MSCATTPEPYAPAVIREHERSRGTRASNSIGLDRSHLTGPTATGDAGLYEQRRNSDASQERLGRDFVDAWFA